MSLNRAEPSAIKDWKEIWSYDPVRSTLTRVTFDPGEDETPAWSNDGK